MPEPHTPSALPSETPSVEPHGNTALVAQCVLIAKPDLMENDRDFAQDDEVKLVVQRVEKFLFYLEKRREKFTKNLSDQDSLEMKTAFEPFTLYKDAREAVAFVAHELVTYPGRIKNPQKMMERLKGFLDKFKKQKNKRFLLEMVRGNSGPSVRSTARICAVPQSRGDGNSFWPETEPALRVGRRRAD